MSHFVIVGAGQAGFSLADTLRKDGFSGRITMIGDEPHPPYQRPPLSKAYLKGEMARERLFFRPPAWFDEAGIDLRLGAAVTALRPGVSAVEIGDERISYDQLALCIGLRARSLPETQGGTLSGVHTIRDLADIDRLAPALDEARRVLVVGGGYIGLEAAAVARERGKSVTLIEAGQRILGRVAAEPTADAVRALHRDHGVEVIENASLERLTGDAGVTGARLADGTKIACDLAIVGVGLDPAVPLADDAGLRTDGGIVVDALGRTSETRVWAAGDCAVLPWGDVHLRLESVQNAIDMGAAVARNMLGAGVPYRPQPWFWSDQYDLKLQIAGLNRGFDRVVVRNGSAPSHWYFADDRLVAVDSLGDARAYMVGKRLIEAGRSPDPAALQDLDTDLKALLKG